MDNFIPRMPASLPYHRLTSFQTLGAPILTQRHLVHCRALRLDSLASLAETPSKSFGRISGGRCIATSRSPHYLLFLSPLRILCCFLLCSTLVFKNNRGARTRACRVETFSTHVICYEIQTRVETRLDACSYTMTIQWLASS